MSSRGCLVNVVFAFVLFVAFGFSTYVWFNFFVRGKSLPTPNLIGKSVADARAICQDLGVDLAVTTGRRNSDKIPVDHIVWQSRETGATSLIKRGATMRVELSAGPLVLRVPELDGQSPRTALLRLGQQNLKLGIITYADAPPAQGIVAEEPPKGTVVGAQTPVSLLVSVTPAPMSYVMPDLIDHALADVRPYLEGHGLVVSTVKFEAYPGIADGVIIRQYPLRGAPVSARDPITVVVSKQEETGIIEQPQPAAAPVTP